jgi:hypothetical protein
MKESQHQQWTISIAVPCVSMTGNPHLYPQVNEAICKAWGLNPNEVKSIWIFFEPHKLPQAEVHLTLNEQVMKLILEHQPVNSQLLTNDEWVNGDDLYDR